MGICVSCRRRERKAPEKRTVPGAGRPAKGAAAAVLLPRRADRLPMMANSMTNIKIKNPIKSIVSKHRKRYMKDGFNLDLAYITDRLIAMGFPAEKLEGVYRNHIDEVYRFLEKMHKDHYKIYNLCTERSYDSSKFHERVEKYAFDDHTPPSIDMIQPFCENVHNWLCADQKNVAAVHCKAGKGRTGTMICCYLLYSRQKTTADEALKFYGAERTYDDKGVTIPSQRRYVEYYAWLLNSGLQYAPTKVHIRELVITPPPFQYAGNTVPELQITQLSPAFQAPMGCHEVRRTETSLHVHLTHCTPLCGDVRVNLNNKQKMKRKLFHFWFNTFFVAFGVGAVSHPPLPDSPNLETFKLTLNKWQLDDAHKDDKHKYFSQDFKVELIVQKLPDSSTFTSHVSASRAPSPQSSTSSSCSEPDTEPDSHWDSGERYSYQPLDYDSDEFDTNTTSAVAGYVTKDSAVGGYVTKDSAVGCNTGSEIGGCKSAVGGYVTKDSAVGGYVTKGGNINRALGDCNSAVGGYVTKDGNFNRALGDSDSAGGCNTGSEIGDCKSAVGYVTNDSNYKSAVGDYPASAVGDFGTGVGNCILNFDSAREPDVGNEANAVGNATCKPVDECKANMSIGGNAVGKYGSAVCDYKEAAVCDYKDPAVCRCEGIKVSGKTPTPGNQYNASAVGDYGNAAGNYKATAGDYAVTNAISDHVAKPSSDYANKSKENDYSNAKNGDGKVIQYTSDGFSFLKPSGFPLDVDFNDPKTPNTGSDYVTDAINARKSRDRSTPTINPLYCCKRDSTNNTKQIPESPHFDQNEPMDTNDVPTTPTSARQSPVEEKKHDKTKPRLSLPSRGDMRASWREFSGIFASDSRRRKDET